MINHTTSKNENETQVCSPPQVQSILSVIVFVTYSLFHFCAVSVSCPKTRVEKWAFLFYTTYVKEKGGR